MPCKTSGLRLLVAALFLLPAASTGLRGQISTVPPHDFAARKVSPGEWMEVTQGVQDARNPLPLVGGRTTWVRVYPAVHPEQSAVLRGLLRVQWAEGVDTVPSMGRAHLAAGEAGFKDERRVNWTSSLNFLLPAHATDSGTVWLELIQVIDAATGMRVQCPDCGRSATEAKFGPPRVLRVKAIGFRLRGSGPDLEPRDHDFANLRSWLWRAYPVTRVEMETAIVDAPAAKPTCDATNAQLIRIRALDIRGGQDPRTRYYGMVPHREENRRKIEFMQGCSTGVPGVPDPSVVASGSAGIPFPKEELFGWDEDGSYADWYGGHEIAHTFGLRHPGWCQLQTRDDPLAAPEDSGRIGGRLERTVAVDPLTVRVFGRELWHDVMAYCANLWVGGRTYAALLRRLAAEDALYAAGAWPHVGSGSAAGVPGAAVEDSLLQVVVRFLHIDANAGIIVAVTPVPVRGRPPQMDSDVLDTIPPELKVTVVVAGARDTVRAQGWIAVNRIPTGTDPDPWAGQSGFVNAFVRNVAGPATIRVLRGNEFVSETEKSAAAPWLEQQVTDSLAQSARGMAHRFTWKLMDPDDLLVIPVAYVQISYDGGSHWSTIQQTWSEQYQLACRTLTHRSSARIRLVASDGVNSAVVYESGELVPRCRAATG